MKDGSCSEHAEHSHKHSPTCGHMALSHEGHTDYLHDGHLHHLHDGHVDEHSIAVGTSNPNTCTPDHHCEAHEREHTHSPKCGHERVPHGDHFDYMVSGHMHHAHGAHCDDHGPIKKAA